MGFLRKENEADGKCHLAGLSMDISIVNEGQEIAPFHRIVLRGHMANKRNKIVNIMKKLHFGP